MSRLDQAGPLLLRSAFTAPLFTAGTLTLTGDRLLGLIGAVPWDRTARQILSAYRDL